MFSFNTRSPYILNIFPIDPTQLGARVTMQIYKKGQTPPIQGQTGFVQLTKLNPTNTPTDIQFNISPYIYDFIKNIQPTPVVVDINTETLIDSDEPVERWTYVAITKYWLDGTDINNPVWTAIGGTFTWIGLDAYSTYQDGPDPGESSNLFMLSDGNLNRTREIIKSTYNSGDFVNFLIDKTTTGNYVDVTYTNFVSAIYKTITVISPSDPVGEYMKKIPLSVYPEISLLGGDVTIFVRLFDSGGTILSEKEIKTTHLDECKYRPVTCYWINRFGGWETLVFWKAKSQKITVKSTEYRLNQKDFYYNPAIGQYKTMNANGRKTIKLNTGWVAEDIGILLEDLLMAETVLITDETTDFKRPVTVKTDSLDIKTHINNKTINYEIEFEFAYDQINNVV
jgi:hypothetical protein